MVQVLRPAVAGRRIVELAGPALRELDEIPHRPDRQLGMNEEREAAGGDRAPTGAKLLTGSKGSFA
jgi:hypothetical protein